DVVEGVLGGVEEALALEPLVEVDDVDVPRAPLVCEARDLAGQLLLADVAGDCDELARLDVRTAHRQVGELRRPLPALTHRRPLQRARIEPCAWTPASRVPESARGAAPTS